ncbi:unnamed protein product [Cuscuta campestris]|uniref:Integrase catalytic domain-containing protein n=1 Tax=Cuscuta campestris TaxID=132261 RepID=A0A484KPN9_9ASTE|nr:unnamed protein product [Cuscuta campestris]
MITTMNLLMEMTRKPENPPLSKDFPMSAICKSLAKRALMAYGKESPIFLNSSVVKSNIQEFSLSFDAVKQHIELFFRQNHPPAWNPIPTQMKIWAAQMNRLYSFGSDTRKVLSNANVGTGVPQQGENSTTGGRNPPITTGEAEALIQRVGITAEQFKEVLAALELAPNRDVVVEDVAGGPTGGKARQDLRAPKEKRKKLEEEDDSSSFERMSAFDRLGDAKSKKPRTSAFERLQDTRSARKGDLRDTLKEKRGESTATSKVGSEERRTTDKGAAELWKMYEQLEKRLDAQNPYRQAVFSEVTPFSRRIMSCPLPDNFKTPQIKAYNGTTDPQDHLARFGANVVIYAAVGYPQTNGQVENTNRTIMDGLKKKIMECKSAWVEELPYILWTYRTTPRKATGETPFSLTYGFEARAPAETSLLSYRVETFDAQENEENLRAELHLVDERRERAYMRAENYRRQVKSYHDQRVRPRKFQVGDWVLRKREVSRSTDKGKFAKSFEGPYIIKEVLADGTFRLQTPAGGDVPRVWNAANLVKFYQ